MAAIGVNSAQLNQISNTIRNNILTQYDAVVTSVRTHAADINSKWRGDAQTAFESQMTTADGYLKQIRAVIEQYGAFLTAAASKYDAADNEATGVIKQMHA
ncbi:hypothetical protein FACS1894184_05090 [Clostridia bacterium]|nr:hypothetical protein FACS1894184_05090 [Clostridia bacterium]